MSEEGASNLTEADASIKRPMRGSAERRPGRVKIYRVVGNGMPHWGHEGCNSFIHHHLCHGYRSIRLFDTAAAASIMTQRKVLIAIFIDDSEYEIVIERYELAGKGVLTSEVMSPPFRSTLSIIDLPDAPRQSPWRTRTAQHCRTAARRHARPVTGAYPPGERRHW